MLVPTEKIGPVEPPRPNTGHRTPLVGPPAPNFRSKRDRGPGKKTYPSKKRSDPEPDAPPRRTNGEELDCYV